MKYITAFLITLLTTPCLAMDLYSANRAKLAFMSNIASGMSENINFEKAPQDSLDLGLLIACVSGNHGIMKLLIEKKSNTQSVHAQLAKVYAELSKDLLATEILDKTPNMPLGKALFSAVCKHQLQLAKMILNKIRGKLEVLNQESVKLALIYAKFLEEYAFVEELACSIDEPTDLDALMLCSKHNIPEVLENLLDDNAFGVTALLKAAILANANQAAEAGEKLFEHLDMKQLLDKAITTICDNDLDTAFNALLYITPNNVRLAFTTRKKAIGTSAKKVLQSINAFLTTKIEKQNPSEELSELDSLMLASKHNTIMAVNDFLSEGMFTVRALLEALILANAHQATETAEALFNHLIKNELLDKAIAIICKGDLDSAFNTLLQITPNKLNLATTAQNKAMKANAEKVLLCINTFLTNSNHVKKQNPRLRALK